MRKTRNTESSRKRRRPDQRPLILKLSAFVFFAVFLGYIICVFTKMECFNIREIKVKGGRDINAAALVGRNIFCVDLKTESRRISRRYPEYKRIRFVRVLPDRVYVDFCARTPLARVKTDKIVLVDEDGFFFTFSSPSDNVCYADLPLIEGIQNRLRKPVEGRRQLINELRFALGLIKDFNCREAFSGLRIVNIEANAAGARMFISRKMEAPGQREGDSVEVKISVERASEKMEILGMLFNRYRDEITKINYIDLRFREPVIKYREDRLKT